MFHPLVACSLLFPVNHWLSEWLTVEVGPYTLLLLRRHSIEHSSELIPFLWIGSASPTKARTSVLIQLRSVLKLSSHCQNFCNISTRNAIRFTAPEKPPTIITKTTSSGDNQPPNNLYRSDLGERRTSWVRQTVCGVIRVCWSNSIEENILEGVVKTTEKD